MVPQLAKKIRRAYLEVILFARGNTPQPSHGLNHFTLRGLHVHVFRHREQHDQFLRLWVLLLEAAQRHDRENVYARAQEQALIMLENPDDFVHRAVYPHRLANRIRIRK